MKTKLVVIDGNSFLYKAYYATSWAGDIKRSVNQDVPINAIESFAKMMTNYLKDSGATHALMAFDKGSITFRHKAYEAYKANRGATPAELKEQIPIARECAIALKVPHLELDMYEADDIIGSAVKRFKDEVDEVEILSADHDLLQLVSKPNVKMAMSRTGVSEIDYFDEEGVYEYLGIWPNQVADSIGFTGDSADNIPGVKGVGPKTMVKLLNKYKTFEGVYENVNDLSPGLKRKLVDNNFDAYISKLLGTVMVDVDIPFNLKDLEYTKDISSEDLFFDKYNIRK